MISKLLLSCAGLWLVGLIGMVVARALFALGPGELGFELPARLWIVGGVSYAICGLLGLRGAERTGSA
jgi:hypothetical protein